MTNCRQRIAMWSGPRNISTAMMRSWGNRPDTFVCDEPLYAHYLRVTGLEHPGADEVIACHENDWTKVVDWLTGDAPEGKAIFYQKQMAHHLLPEIDRGWLNHVTNAFLIRNPAEMLASLHRVLTQISLTDTGLPQQVEIFRQVREKTGRIPPVVDARDVLENPRRMLNRLCEALEVPFVDDMLEWPAGPRATDGVWAKHWYANVEKTSTFEPYSLKPVSLPEQLEVINGQCQKLYQELYEHRLLA